MDKKIFLSNFLTALSIGLIIFYGLNFFGFFSFNNNSKNQIPENIQPGQAYRVPTKEELMRPVNREIDFIDKKVTQKEELAFVDTDLYEVSFSNYGATLVGLKFKKRLGKDKEPLHTIQHNDFFKREEASFLIALDEKTPYFYNYISKEDKGNKFDITYEVESDGTLIRKIYSVYKDSYKIDLNVEIKTKKLVRPRLFLSAPFVSELPEDLISGFVFNDTSKQIDVISNVEDIRLIPQVFGAQDKYFAHTLIEDKNNLVQRAYFKMGSTGRLVSIYEGIEVKGQESFILSFYMGPKDLQDLNAVDSKLEGLLNFGWLSWLCKLLLRMLEFLYKYLGNFGYAIIALTILIKIPLLPLSIKGASIMEKMQRYQPQLKAIRAKYKGDMKQEHEEVMRFYREHDIPPSGQLYGCASLLVDMPIMFALYKILGNYMDLYQAPFFLWITDLSSKDPYYVLPVLMGISMFWQQKLSPIGDEKTKIIQTFLPILLVGVFANFAAGLVLYWLVKNLLTVGETYFRRAFVK